MAVASWMWEQILTIQLDRKPPKFNEWANTIRLMREQDGRTHDQIRALYALVNRHAFWHDKVLSPAKLREKWDDLRLQLESPASRFNGNGRANGSPARVCERSLNEYF
jgi:hypothetical protein